MPRKTLLFLLLIMLVTTGCQTDSAEPENVIVAEPSAVQLLIAADDFAVGSQRLPFVLYDGPDVMTTAQSVSMRVLDLRGETLVTTWEGDATYYDDYDVPYWVIYPTFDAAAQWGLEFDVTMADGALETVRRRVDVAESAVAPDVGALPPAVVNKTVADEPLSRLTSAENPTPALYEMTIADAMVNGKPTLISFSTPAFCATQLCAPSLDSFVAVTEPLADRVNAIHVEIFDMGRYEDSESADLVVAESVQTWGLTSEPWTYVLDAGGTVVARLAGPVAPSELQAVVARVLP